MLNFVTRMLTLVILMLNFVILMLNFVTRMLNLFILMLNFVILMLNFFFSNFNFFFRERPQMHFYETLPRVSAIAFLWTLSESVRTCIPMKIFRGCPQLHLCGNLPKVSQLHFYESLPRVSAIPFRLISFHLDSSMLSSSSQFVAILVRDHCSPI